MAGDTFRQRRNPPITRAPRVEAKPEEIRRQHRTAMDEQLLRSVLCCCCSSPSYSALHCNGGCGWGFLGPCLTGIEQGSLA